MRTGTFTSPNVIAPLQIALGMSRLLPTAAKGKRRGVSGERLATLGKKMGSRGSRGIRAALCVAVALLTLSAPQASGAKQRHGASCTWGASSIHARIVDGKIVSSAPATSGCARP
jgi:hypothetical protein